MTQEEEKASIALGSPQSFNAARAEFITLLEQSMRKKGRRDLLTLVLGGFAHQTQPRMLEKWWVRASTDPVARDLLHVDLGGAEGWERLESVRMLLDEWLTDIASRRAPLEWSGILRRVSHELLRRLPLTAEEIITTSMRYASKSPKRDSWSRFKTQGWLPRPDVLTDLDDLISVVIILRNVITCQRRISKGQSLVLDKLFAPVTVTSDPAIEAAIQLYDDRNRMSFGGGNSTGSTGGIVATTESTAILVGWMDIRGHKLLTAEDEERLLKDHDPIFPLGIDINRLAPSVVFPESITKETVALGMVLDTAWRWLESKGAHFATKRGIWTKSGYLDCSKRWFLRELLKHQTPIPGITITLDPSEVINILKPSSLSVVYPAGPRIIIDLLHASHLLSSTIFRANDGTNANAWGAAFENEVQSMIDSTPWRPPDEFRPLIGRVIRNGRNAITDIDAVAFTGGTLLLIDAKAFRVSSALAHGEYSATRTMREKVESASTRWRDIILQVRQDPKVLGVPIPKGLEINGLVVLPFTPYVSIGPATEPVLQLFRASSIIEFYLVATR